VAWLLNEETRAPLNNKNRRLLKKLEREGEELRATGTVEEWTQPAAANDAQVKKKDKDEDSTSSGNEKAGANGTTGRQPNKQQAAAKSKREEAIERAEAASGWEKVDTKKGYRFQG